MNRPTEDPECPYIRRLRKFAWLPTRMGMGYVIWLTPYTEMQQLMCSQYDEYWETLWRHDNV